MRNYNFLKILTGLFFALILIFLGCKEDSETSELTIKDADDATIIEYLIGCGFQREDIEVGREGCVVEGDMVFDCDVLLNHVKANETPNEFNEGVTERQRAIHSAFAVSSNNVSNINYFVHSSVNNCVNPSQWLTAISSAVTNWNSMSNCRVNFVQVSQQSQANLIISSDEATNTFLSSSPQMINIDKIAPRDTIARAKEPNNNNIGKYITIGKYSNPNSLDKRIMTIMHEMGHALGFYHCNGTDGQHLFDTSDPDGSTSIMYSGLTATTAFNSNDRRAARLLYPDLIFMPGSFSAVAAGTRKVKITVNTPQVNYPSYYLLCEQWPLSGGTQPIKTFDPIYSGTSFILSNITPGTYRFKVRGANYKKDVFSSYTSFITVTVP